MPDSIVSDRTMRAVQFALDGLTKQQETIGHNLANVDTPGYRAKTLDFKSTLRRAIHTSEAVSLQTTHAAHLASPNRLGSVNIVSRKGGTLRADGNNVDIEVELSQMAETGIHYQALSQLASKKLILLREIASRR